MPIPQDFEMLIPWRIIEEQHRAEALSARLSAEVSPKHWLYGVKAHAVAIRLDRDDVLFELEGCEQPLAVVHITWRKETDTRWPTMKLFESWEQWIRDEMIPANEEFVPS